MTAATCTSPAIGVGFDTARYGHHATFLREDRQVAAKPLEFLESRSGYQRLENAFAKLARQNPNVHFYIRVDAAGQYAANLLAFLHRLPCGFRPGLFSAFVASGTRGQPSRKGC